MTSPYRPECGNIEPRCGYEKHDYVAESMAHYYTWTMTWQALTYVVKCLKLCLGLNLPSVIKGYCACHSVSLSGKCVLAVVVLYLSAL